MFPPLSCPNLMNRSPGVRSVSLWLLFSKCLLSYSPFLHSWACLSTRKYAFFAFESIHLKKKKEKGKKVFCIVGFLKTACLLLSKICMSECTETLTWLWSFPSFIIFMRPWTGIMERGCSERKKKRGKLTRRKRKGKEEVSWEADVGRRKFIHLCLIYSSRI